MISSSHIHLALSPWDITNEYNRHVGVTIISVLEHCTQPITIHLLCDEKLCVGKENETEYTKKCYQKIAGKYGCEILYHHVELPHWIHELKRVNKFTPGALLRLNLPEVLPNVDKVLYLDCDTLVLTDIYELWKINVDGKYLAGAIDEGFIKNIKLYKNEVLRKKISHFKYFNSGVLLLNLRELRKISFTKKSWEFLKNNLGTFCEDQDAMNYVCDENNFIEFDWRFNNICHMNEMCDNCILHPAGQEKPWNVYTHSYNDIYWDYLRQSPWCEDMHIFYSYLREAPDFSKIFPFLERNFFHLIQGTQWQRITSAIRFEWRIIKFGVKEWFSLKFHH